MKYYIGKILERNGDFEYTSDYLFQTEGDPHEYADDQAKEWRGSDDDDWDDDHEGWWCDHTLIFNEGFREVTESEFFILNKYLPTL